jgi:hypothetical protein
MSIAFHFKAWAGDIFYRRVDWSFRLKPIISSYPGAVEIQWLFIQAFWMKALGVAPEQTEGK